METNPLKRIPMPHQDGKERSKNFSEVALGYTEEMAKAEASRCLNCKNAACVKGCPVNVDIPKFISLLKENKIKDAYDVITKTNTLPAVCGRVCPQERQCEGNCIRGIKGESVSIGRLERFVADYVLEHSFDAPEIPESNGKRVAVIGSGPAGLSCAGTLAQMGYKVTIFEAFHTPGGVLVYGIPEFRLPKSIVAKEIKRLTDMGVEIITNMVIGKVLSVDEVIEMGYDALFIGSGAGLPMFMGIEGENALGVYSANEFLTRINLMKAYLDDFETPIKKARNFAVVGGGNVAMDAARCAIRLGADNVYVIYRRTEEEMPARREEILHAKEEGIEFKFLCNPKRILTDENGNAKAIECIRMELGEPDQSGRRRPIEIEGSEFLIEADACIMALGTSPNPLIHSTTPDISVNKRGCLIVNESLETSKEGVFAGGDAVTGAATVILAMGAGKTAAESIHKYLNK